MIDRAYKRAQIILLILLKLMFKMHLGNSLDLQ